VWAAGAGLAVTLVAVLLPEQQFTYRNLSLHVALDTVDGLIALLVGYLVFGRFNVSGRRSDLVLSYALMLLGFTSLFASALPSILTSDRAGTATMWGAFAARFVGAVAFAVAPLVKAPEGRSRVIAGPIVGAIATVLFCVSLSAFSDALPDVVTMTPEGTLQAHVVAEILGFLTAGAFIIGTVGFTMRAEERDDWMYRFFGAGAALFAAARLNFYIVPSIYSEFIYSGDLLRLAGYVVLLYGASREIRAYWQARAEGAAWEERRRMARELHDGLAQELAFLVSQTRYMRKRDGHGSDIEMLATSAERAWHESRRAIAAVADDEGPVADAVSRICSELARREKVAIGVSVQPDLAARPDAREELLRIVREAVTNAARHGNAQQITVSMFSRDDVITLRVRDDGAGFDPSEATHRLGFGLTTMSERARLAGGTLTISSAPGEGAEVEVLVPIHG
jgi:signal transduction histidine kinase